MFILRRSTLKLVSYGRSMYYKGLEVESFIKMKAIVASEGYEV